MQAARSDKVAGTIGTFRWFGVPIRLHFTLVLLLVYLGVVAFSGRQAVINDVVYVVAMFTSVLLHELGHALASRQYGIGTIEIVLFPIGGVARLARTPKPREELWIAAAGPLVNLVIGGGLLVADQVAGIEAELARRVAWGNLVLALFNLIPAFPMDGGRMLRAGLALFRPAHQATRIATVTGRAMAVAMGLYGVVSGQYFLVFVAFLIYGGASQEGAASAGRTLAQGIPVRNAMVTDFQTLSHGDSIGDAARLLIATSQQDFPVLHGGSVVGLLGRPALLRAMADAGPDSYVAAAMDRNFLTLDPRADLSEALPLLSTPGACVLVIEGGRLIGMLTAENLSEFLVLQQIGMPRSAET